MEFLPYDRLLTRKEIAIETGLTIWQVDSLLKKYGKPVGCQRSISLLRLKELIDDGTVYCFSLMHGGRPKKEG